MTATERSRQLTIRAAQAASAKLGSDQIAFDVSDQLAIADTFLIVTAASERQVGAVVDAVEEALLAEQARPLRREGSQENRWVLLDYGDLVVHVQHAEERRLYTLGLDDQPDQRPVDPTAG